MRDATDDYRLVGELPAHGVGPHEVVLMPDGKTLAVANGGIRTHPDHDRVPLNLATMQPSLTWLEIASGRQEGAVRPPAALHQLGIRHATVNARGLVAVAMQYEGSKQERVPLVALAEGEELRFLEAPDDILRRCANTPARSRSTGAASCSRCPRRAAACSPSGMRRRAG